MEKIINQSRTDDTENGKITMSQDSSSNSLPLPPPPSAGKMNMKVVALAAVCIILAASLVGVFAVYQPTSLQAQIKDKNNQITDLNAQVANLTSQLASANDAKTTLQDQNSVLTTEVQNLTDQVNLAQGILDLQSSEALVTSTSVNTANYTDVFSNTVPYAGYVVVQASSNSTATYVQTIYSVFGVTYNENVTVGKSGTAAFPVLPTTVEIRVGTTDRLVDGVTVTITYYY